jgi:hypothetical protein
MISELDLQERGRLWRTFQGLFPGLSPQFGPVSLAFKKPGFIGFLSV